MATQLLLEGPSLEALLEKVHAEHGPKARVVSADRLRKGGLAGFFSKQWFEIGVELPDTDAPAAEVATHASSAVTVDALLNLADDADSAEVSAPSFGAILAEAAQTVSNAASTTASTTAPTAASTAAATTAPPAPRSEPKPAPWTIMEPEPAESKPEPAAKPAVKPAAKPAKPKARRAPGPQLLADLPQVRRPTRRTPAPRAVAELTPALRSTQRAAALRTTPPAGASVEVAPAFANKPVAAAAKPATPAPRKKTGPTRVTGSAPLQAGGSDFSDVLVALPGRVVVVAGELPWALDVANWVCRRMRVAPHRMLVAGPDVSGDHRRVNGPEHAATLAAELHASDAPVVVVVDAPVAESDGGRWAAAMADALGADAVIAVVDATRKTADLRRHLDDLGTVQAMAVYAAAAAIDPNTVLDLGVPVMLVDGQPVGATAPKPVLLAAS